MVLLRSQILTFTLEGGARDGVERHSADEVVALEEQAAICRCVGRQTYLHRVSSRVDYASVGGEGRGKFA